MTSIKISSFQLHEQMIELRLNFEYRVHYDSDIEINEVSKNQLSFQALYIRFRTLKQKNEILKQKNARLRARRNDYRQKFHQLKKKMIALRTQLEIALRKQQHDDSIVYDSNVEKQFRKSDILRFDSHFFNRITISFSFFVISVFSISKRFLLFYIDMTSHTYHIKYSNIDDFYDDKDKWKQWKKDLLTKIWICSLQFSIEQHKINYARRHTKEIAYDIIKTRARIDSDSFYSTIDELLKNLNVSFDQIENIKQRNVYVKIFDDNFRMIEIEKFEIFIIRYIVVVVDFQIIDEILIHQLKMKLFSTLRYNIWHLIEIHEYQKFVEDFRYAIIDFEKFRIRRSEKSYSNFYSLTRKKKKQLDNIENCYKCHQSKHKINDKNAFCKHISWMLKQTKRWSFEQRHRNIFIKYSINHRNNFIEFFIELLEIRMRNISSFNVINQSNCMNYQEFNSCKFEIFESTYAREIDIVLFVWLFVIWSSIYLFICMRMLLCWKNRWKSLFISWYFTSDSIVFFELFHDLTHFVFDLTDLIDKNIIFLFFVVVSFAMNFMNH